MKKVLLSILLTLSFGAANAQCPNISGAMIDASNAGTPSGEGKNEFLVFNTGSSSVNVNSIFLSYGTSTIATSFSVDGAAVPSVWTTAATSGLLTNSLGTITNVTSGIIPANKNVVVISKDNAINYDFQTFGTDVYVLSYDQSLAGVFSFSTGGNFANTGAASRYLRISQGATCRDTVSYIPNSLSGGDGGGAKWSSSGSITYVNTGSSGAILPLNLTKFDGQINNGISVLQWRTSGNSTAQYFEIEKSKDGILYTKIGNVAAENGISIAEKQYQFTDVSTNSQVNYYRLRMIDFDEEFEYSPSLKLSTNSISNTSITNIHPNPFSTELRIINQQEFSSMLIFDLMGKVLVQKTLHDGENIIDVSDLNNGLYLIQLNGEGKSELLKVWKN